MPGLPDASPGLPGARFGAPLPVLGPLTCDPVVVAPWALAVPGAAEAAGVRVAADVDALWAVGSTNVVTLPALADGGRPDGAGRLALVTGAAVRARLAGADGRVLADGQVLATTRRPGDYRWAAPRTLAVRAGLRYLLTLTVTVAGAHGPVHLTVTVRLLAAVYPG